MRYTVFALLILVGACSTTQADESSQDFGPTAEARSGEPPRVSTPAGAINPTATVSTNTLSTNVDEPAGNGAIEAPAWLGTRVLQEGVDGRVIAQATPALLRNRRFITQDVLPPPPTKTFVFKIGPLEGKALDDSTWHPGCPVAAEDLRVLTMSHWGFDAAVHTGRLIVHRSVAQDIVEVFGVLFEAGFPIEEMSGVTDADLEAEPTGDGNNTESFVCRPVTGGTSFSQHAYGLAIDINPFHNPYVNDGWVLPELATSYLDRDRVRPGMILEGDSVTAAFDEIGWGWGGRWQTLKDYQHFALNDR